MDSALLVSIFKINIIAIYEEFKKINFQVWLDSLSWKNLHSDQFNTESLGTRKPTSTGLSFETREDSWANPNSLDCINKCKQDISAQKANPYNKDIDMSIVEKATEKKPVEIARNSSGTFFFSHFIYSIYSSK